MPTVLSASQVLKRVELLRSANARRAQHCFWAEGVRQFVQAADAGLTIEVIVESPILLQNPLAQMLSRKLAATGVPRVKVSPEEFRSVSLADRVSGIGAIVRQRWSPLHAMKPERGLAWLVVEHIRSAGNMGTILRTAEATSIAGVIFVGHQTDPFHPACVRASMGGLMHLALARASIDEMRLWVKRHGIQMVGASPNAPCVWNHMPRNDAAEPRIALVLGEERKGISQQLAELCTTAVSLPMTGRADSLNVSVAAGILMYEVVRQRGITHFSETGHRQPDAQARV